MKQKVTGNLIDLHDRRIYPAEITIVDQHITAIEEIDGRFEDYLLPGFVDAHIHIESSMLVPYEFAKIALTHGTIATISDPHEIANVLGINGVHYMIDNAKDAILKFHFGAPSCVPATNFEMAGATINSNDVKALMEMDDIYYLSEVMNYPDVLQGDKEVLRKIDHARNIGKPIDGHAPGLMGQKAKQYIDAGISTDHECFTIEEALDKLKYGMKILIREGSAAKNYEALHTLIDSHPEEVMFCSDDKHPDDLLQGHINELVVRSVKLGYDLFDVLRIASVHPVLHYNMDVGLLRVGDKADFIRVNNTSEFRVLEVYVNGKAIAKQGRAILGEREHATPNNFGISEISIADFKFNVPRREVQIIQAIDGQLITNKLVLDNTDGKYDHLPNSDQDLLKIAVINRYQKAPFAKAFIKGFGINNGAIASTVAHDSHNLVVVGTSDEQMCRAAELLIENQGGLSAVKGKREQVIPLPVAGIMSNQNGVKIGAAYSEIDQFVKTMGCPLDSPFMTLSFMCLLVIPKIKLSDRGLFDAEKFEFIR